MGAIYKKAAEGIASLVLKSKKRLLGSPTKLGPDWVKASGGKDALYFNKKDLYRKKHPTGFRWLLHPPKSEEDVILAGYGSKAVPMKRKDTIRVKYGNHYYNTPKEVSPNVARTREVRDVIKKVTDEQGTEKFLKRGKDLQKIVNDRLKSQGLDPVSIDTTRIYFAEIAGKQHKVPVKGTPLEDKVVSYLKGTDEISGKRRGDFMSSTDMVKDPLFPHPNMAPSNLNEFRQRYKLSRIPKKGAQPLQEAMDKFRGRLKSKRPYLEKDEIEAYTENFRIKLKSPVHTKKLRFGDKYSDDQIDEGIRLIEDTDLRIRGNNPELKEYMAMRKENRELSKTLPGKERYVMGHLRGEAADQWWFGGYEMPTIERQLASQNYEALKLQAKFKKALREGNITRIKEVLREMKEKGIRSSYVNPEGFQHFFGSPRKEGKMAQGGIVNGYAGGGFIKKLLDESIGAMSRRKFLKGVGAVAAQTALPRGALKLAPSIAKKAAFDFAPPWISQMATALGSAVKHKKPVKLPNGTVIEYLKKPHTEYDSHKLAVKTVDGEEDLVNYKARKNGDEVEIEFDIRDEGHNNQHIFLDKKNKVAELIDENYYMTSPEDFAKDDPIIWNVSKPAIKSDISQTATSDISKKALDRSIILDKSTKADDYIYDYMSMPEGSDYNYMWERYVDSFSPAGNIFKTKEYAKKIRKQEATQKKLREERAMDNWENQFRGGHGQHAYKDGGLTKTVPPAKGPASNFVEEGISMIKANPQRFVAGGLVKRFAPKVMGKKSIYKPLIMERKLGKGPDLSKVKTELYEAPKGPYTITDEYGSRILEKDFKALEEAQLALGDLAKLRTQDASTFKIFGKRPPKTAEGVSEGAPEVNIGMVGKPLPKESPAAMFWGSREKIINAPYEVMTGKQWLRFLKGFDEEQVFADTKKAESILGSLRDEGKFLSKNFGDTMKLHRGNRSHPDVVAALKAHKAHQLKVKKANDDLARLKLAEREGTGKEFHERILNLRESQKRFPPIRDMELNDTGLAPHLSRNSSKMLSKEQLVKDFDKKLAPEIEVVSLGRTGDEGEKFYNQMSKMDMQAYREGPVKNVLMGIRNQAHPLKEAISNNNNDAILKIINEIDKLTFDNFGVANAIKEGFPQKFPFELKKVLQRIAQATGVRTSGFKKYAKDVQYKGEQVLGGGENYREFLFKYKHPTGSLRETEPFKRYEDLGAGHFSSLRNEDQMGGFVHTRVSDRTDEFGRRILHIEEIQSDLHQKVNAAARRVRKDILDGKKPKASDIKGSKYAPRGDLIKETTDLANEQQMQLVLSKIEDLASLPQTQKTQIRIARLNKERAKIRKIIEDKKAKMSKGDHSGFAMGPLSKSEDYNEFVMKYLTKVAQEGGYDGVTISSGAIKNRGEAMGSLDWKGNLVAYGPIAEGAMKKVAKKSGAKYLKTSIIDNKGRGWSVPMIWLDNTAVKFNVQKGLPIYKKGGMVVNG